jgi:hypothetical protein
MIGSWAGRFTSACAVLGLLGCAVSYDQTIDQQVTTVTQEGDQQLALWENALAARQTIPYDPGSYSKIQGDLQALETRLENAPDVETRKLAPVVASQVTLWNNIRDTQIGNPFVADYLTTQGAIFNYNMGLLTLYELSLRSGASTSAAGTAVSAAQSAGPALSPKPGS